MNRAGLARVQAPMPSKHTAPPGPASPTRTPGNRVIQGALLGGGALVLALTAGADRLPFYWTPLILGLSYLVAAIVDGPRGGYWATALGLTGWGLAVVYMGEARPPDIDPAGAYLVGAGLAGVAAALLSGRGFVISPLGLAATIAAGGLVLALTPRAAGTLDDATTYAVALGVVGVLNVAGGVYQVARAKTGAAA
jgi:hypothetical protein